eukprot:scaffold4002_cov256-Prasinococcus_capsulatus_cf.AAC.1
MTECHPKSTPVPTNYNRDPQSVPLDAKDTNLYLQIVGSMMYLAVCTRPDIAYLMHCLCKGMSQPTVLHMELAKRGLAYIKKTQDWGLYYTERSPLVGYTDSDWANDTENRKSITGYCFLLNGASIISYSKQQKNVATSSGAAEYMSASTGAVESRFIQQLLEE